MTLCGPNRDQKAEGIGTVTATEPIPSSDSDVAQRERQVPKIQN